MNERRSHHRPRGEAILNVLLSGAVALFIPACSLKRTAVNILGDALAGSGGKGT